FGVCENNVNGSTNYVLIDKDADWIRNCGQTGLHTDGKRVTIEGKQLAFSIMSYWQSKFLSLGKKVLETLEGSLQYSKSNGSVFHQGASLLYMFDLSKFLLDCEYLNVTISKDLVPLRLVHLENRLLEEIILHYVDTKEDLTYWTIRRVTLIFDHAEFLLDLLSGRNNISCLLPKKFVGDILRKKEDKKLNLNIEVVAEALLSINDPLVIVSSSNVTPKIAATCALFVDLRKSEDEILSISF
ncbi:hypothetical protein Tco_0561746, partial [Tanacetum coccineum]